MPRDLLHNHRQFADLIRIEPPAEPLVMIGRREASPTKARTPLFYAVICAKRSDDGQALIKPRIDGFSCSLGRPMS
jgi:hypothetical protein